VTDPLGPGFTLRVDGTPAGWQRARVNMTSRRHFNDPKTTRAEGDVVVAWIGAGSPRLPDGPVAITVEAVLARPKGHHRRDGSLSAAGERLPWPLKKPDWDNVAKLIGDALNGRAYHDDAHIVQARVVKRWAVDGEHEHTLIRLEPAGEPPAVVGGGVRAVTPLVEEAA
jgi:Holliday junction resolvase RusA-like endonuclease